MLYTLILLVHIVTTVALVALILLQTGKGAEAGAACGGGASAGQVAPQGAASFLSRGTSSLATLFFITSLTLAYLSGQEIDRTSVTDDVEPLQVPGEQEPTDRAPAAPDVPAPTE